MLGNDFGNVAIFIGGLIIIFSLFLLARELLCWYWKINKIVDLLEDIKKNTSTSKKDQSPQSPQI